VSVRRRAFNVSRVVAQRARAKSTGRGGCRAVSEEEYIIYAARPSKTRVLFKVYAHSDDDGGGRGEGRRRFVGGAGENIGHGVPGRVVVRGRQHAGVRVRAAGHQAARPRRRQHRPPVDTQLRRRRAAVHHVLAPVARGPGGRREADRGRQAGQELAPVRPARRAHHVLGLLLHVLDRGAGARVRGR